jgi:hypothetical protein
VAIWFRDADPRWPFLWDSVTQPPMRWHGPGEGPAHYLADTPDGAWAEYLRHQEITDPADLPGIRRHLWAIELPDGEPAPASPVLPLRALRGGVDSYARCQKEARRLRKNGASSLEAPSAALLPGSASGELSQGFLIEAEPRDGRVRVLFGERGDLRGWLTAVAGHPGERVLGVTRPL